MTAIEAELRAAREHVLHDPPTGATERVAAAVAAAQPRRRARRRWLRSIVGVAVVAATLVGTVILAGSIRSRTAAPGSPLTVIAPAPGVAAAIPVIGATPLEERTVRALLAGLGAPSPVESVLFDDHAPLANGPARRRVVIRPSIRDAQTTWLAGALAQNLIATLQAAGEPIQWAVFGGERTRRGWRTATAPAVLEQLALAGIDRGRAAGFVTSATIYPIGAIAYTFRYDDDHYLAPPRTDWSRLTQADAVATSLRVEAPNGMVVFASQRLSSYLRECGACGVTGADRAGPLPATMNGPTMLDVAVTLIGVTGYRAPDMIWSTHHASFHLNCARSADAQVCDAITRDRYALFTPPIIDGNCADQEGRWVDIRGQIGGVTVHRTYRGCYRPVTDRWILDLAAVAVKDRWITDLIAAGMKMPPMCRPCVSRPPSVPGVAR